MSEAFDTVGFIMDAEMGVLDDEQLIEGVQHLIDTGIIRGLQGSWQRIAHSLIEQGYCTHGQV